MATTRTFRLAGSQAELMERLQEVVESHRSDDDDEHVELIREGGGFKLLLGSGELGDLAACARGTLTEGPGALDLEVRSGLVGVDRARLFSRELLRWALAILAFVGIIFFLAHLTGARASTVLLRWLILPVGITGYRCARRLLRIRQDAAELLSLVERAAGPLAALPAAGPFRERALPARSSADDLVLAPEHHP
ncbi:MAG: hypothetical protein KC420_18555 [Myxococcales bacterium]|nr:hypothetical protein [Myxococcales bacterium]